MQIGGYACSKCMVSNTSPTTRLAATTVKKLQYYNCCASEHYT